MSKFKIGDRVRCTHGGYLTPKKGWTGTVYETGTTSFNAHWDGHTGLDEIDDCCDDIRAELIEEEHGLKTTKERVLEAAKTSKEAEKALKELFPEIFPPEPFEFGKEFKITTESSPLFIGKALAPAGLYQKCLIVGSSCEIKVQEHDGYKILTFHPKR